MRPLLDNYPELAGRIAHLPLCDLPTPVQSVPGLVPGTAVNSLFVKRDDLSANEYGGNKVRKLEFLLGAARAAGCQETLAFGFSGSNFAAATAHYAARLGMTGISMLLPQKPALYVLENLLLGCASGAELHHASGPGRLAWRSAMRRLRSRITRGRAPYTIPVGGSSPIGILGFVNAALELGEQVHRGETPRPDRVYIAMGSMGSVAGLLLGFQILGWHSTRVIAVRTIDEGTTNAPELFRLHSTTARLLRQKDSTFAAVFSGSDPAACPSSVEIRHEYYGGTYGETPASRLAIDRSLERASLRLDPTYSGKAMAALLEDADAGLLKNQNVLFWATYNSRPLAPLIGATSSAALPADFQVYARVGESAAL